MSHLDVYYHDAALDEYRVVVSEHGLVGGDMYTNILELPSLNDPAECQNYKSHPRQPRAHHVYWLGLTVSSCVPLGVTGYVIIYG